MKSFKQLGEEVLNEGGEHYPADDMTLSELKIACYAAQNILAKLEDGAMIQRWQISAIVKAKEELSSVYTSISADEQDEMDDVEAWMNSGDEDEEGEYVGYEYPSMYGEETEQLAEGKKKGLWDNIRARRKKGLSPKKPGDEGYPKTLNIEETDYKVSVDGLPDMYVKADNPGEVKTNLRKIVKNPEMIRSVDRVTQAVMQKIFRDKAAGKEEEPEKSSKKTAKPHSK